jgi:hypothetical protein
VAVPIKKKCAVPMERISKERFSMERFLGLKLISLLNVDFSSFCFIFFSWVGLMKLGHSFIG